MAVLLMVRCPCRADIALIGLAVMGQNLILNMNDHNFVVSFLHVIYFGDVSIVLNDLLKLYVRTSTCIH